MGLGPVHAATAILERQHLKPKDMDVGKLMRPLLLQVLGCMAAWDDEDYCKNQSGLKEALGAPSFETLKS